MKQDSLSSPVSPQQYAGIPQSSSSQGIPRVSSVTRHREAFTHGKVDSGVLDISVDEDAGLELDDGARSIRFMSAASNIDSVLGATTLERPATPIRPRDHMHLDNHYSNGQECAHGEPRSRIVKEGSSVKVQSLIALFEAEPETESITNVVDSENSFTKESSTKSVRKLAALFNDVPSAAVPTENRGIEDETDVSFQSMNPASTRKHGTQACPVDGPRGDEIEEEKSTGRDASKDITPLNTKEIDAAIEEIGLNKAASQKYHRLTTFSSPLTPVKSAFTSLKKLNRGPSVTKKRSEEDPSPFVGNEMEMSKLQALLRSTKSGEGGRTPDALRKMPSFLRLSASNSMTPDVDGDQNMESPRSVLYIDKDNTRRRQRNVLKEAIEAFSRRR